jgi:uncharacterized protein
MENISLPPGPIKKQVWGFWATAGLGLATGIVFLLVQTLTVLPFVIAALAGEPGLDVSELTNRVLENGDLFSAATIAAAVVCVGFILLMIKARGGESITQYLALKSISRKTIARMFVITAVFILLSIAVSALLPEQPGSDYTTTAYNNASIKPLFWVAVVIFAPIFEEAFVRGFLFIGFRQSRIGPAGAIILTTLIWAALHMQYDIFQIAVIFVLGIILGIVRHKTDSLWSPLIIHSFNNLVAMVLISLN